MSAQEKNKNLLKSMDIVSPLLRWYDNNARVLPWRDNPDPYRVWISEIMLQQTRVEAVKPYYLRFLKAFPTIQDLAKADEEELLKAWEGLGYYNRIRNMHKTAVLVTEEFSGQLPSDYEALLSLPGIGPYTAGAVASIAYNIAAPAVDGNVLRVITRLLADDRDISSAAFKRQVEEMLCEIMPKRRPGDFNQALMELGAVVCLPGGEPDCGVCPWGKLCRARKLSMQRSFPRKKPKKERVVEEKTVLLIRDGDRVALRKRPDRGLLAGLYEFPCLEGRREPSEVLDYMKKELELVPIRIQELKDSKHIFTHREWRMRGYMIRVGELEEGAIEGLIFVKTEDTERKYPIPSAFSAYTEYMNIRLGNKK